MNRVLIFGFMLLLPFCMVAQSPQKLVVYFPFNKYYVSNGAAKALDSILKANAGKTIDSIKIYAFCDSIGKLLPNDTLAIKRALSVREYLQRRGIGSNKFIELNGTGKRSPVNDNSTEALRTFNRRAEIFVFSSAPLVPDRLGEMIRNIPVGEKVGLSDINFFGGRHILLPSAIPQLESLTKFLKANAGVEIEIQGYVCCIPLGEDAYDQDERRGALSLNRARTVYDYLVAHGITASRLSYKGFGNHPLVPDNSEQNHTLNRRVEIKILKR